MKGKYIENQVLKMLYTKNDVRVNADKREVEVLNGASSKPKFHKKSDLGIKSWGKIDFLVNCCGYRLYWVAEFTPAN